MANHIYIESLQLTNFGPFYGDKNEIDFRTKTKAPPHVLIGGQNGAGKTHILRALYLAITGAAGIADLRSVEADSGATRFNFDHLLNRRARREGKDKCSVTVRIVQRDADTGDERRLTLEREIRFRPNSGPVWRSIATKSDGSPSIEDQDMIERLRDAYLPRHLARFFFFDAEKSQNLQLGDEEIVKGISRILGLWSYEALEEDLRTLVQNTNRDINNSGASSASEKLGEVSGRLIQVKSKIRSVDEKSQARILEKNDSESQLLDIEDQLKTVGAIDPQKLTENQKRRTEAAEAKGRLENILVTAWELALPIEILGGLRAQLLAQLAAEKLKRNWEDRKAAVSPQLPRIQTEVFESAPAPFRLADDTLAFYTNRLDRALKSLFDPPPQGVEGVNIHVTETAEAAAAITALLAKGSTGLADIAEASRKLELIEEDVRRLDHEIRQQTQNVAAIGAGERLHEKRAMLRAEIDRLSRELDDLVAEKTRLEMELTELSGEETKWSTAVKDADKGRDLVARASAYREAASELRKRASDKMRSQLNEVVGDLWIDIMGRRREFDGMRFDPYWNCDLIRKNGEKVRWDDINSSAGQRQVRLLAFYEALRRLAQSVPPLVVDTPLGRLDKEVREAVLTKLYLNDDGHQSIVLSTNAEIDPEGELFAKVRYRFGRAYTLVPVGKPGSEDYEVEIQPRYFERKVTE
jgi:DNA sulfur modification protein DndD